MPTLESDTPRGHALMPDALAALFPKLYALDGQGMNAPVTAKLFHSNATVFLTEFDGNNEFFGYICSPLGQAFNEWTYFTLTQFAQETRPDIPNHPLWERDIAFSSGTILAAALADHYRDSGVRA